jgi:protein-L-isoaspartate(D-aspartate) O-methyltransferase
MVPRAELSPLSSLSHSRPAIPRMTDPRQQRIAMVENQVRACDVTDRRIVKAMLEVPREEFAPPFAQAIAYMDAALPLARRRPGRPGRYLLPPRTLAKLLQVAEIDADDVALDVGCGSGYSTAVLARLAKGVVALEVERDLAAEAERALRKLGVVNAMVVEGPLAAGAPAHAPFDIILLNGSVAEPPQHLLAQLKERGRLLAVLADGNFGAAQVWRRAGKGFDAVSAFDAGAEPLPGFARQSTFTL